MPATLVFGVMLLVRVALILDSARFAEARCKLENVTSNAQKCGDLFGNLPPPRSGPMVKTRVPPELTSARMLCRQLQRKRAPREKQRIAHLMCLNLLSMLRRGS
jgi:hypothetical protein